MIRIKELRKEQSKTLKAVAEALGTSHQVISRYELEITQPDFDTLIRIANYFNVSVDYLLGRTEDRQGQNLQKEKGLSENEQALIELFNCVPEDKQALVLSMIQVALKNLK